MESQESSLFIKGANSWQWKACSKITSKMAGQVPVSPLLCQRPDFLGIGKGSRGLNIFSELIKLSGLSRIIPVNTLTTCHHHDIANYLETAHNETINSVMFEDHCNREKEVIKNSSSTLESHKVFELDSNGKPTKLIEYHLSDKTLFLFNTLTRLKISFRTEIYRTKGQRLGVDSGVLYCKNLFLKDRKGAFFLMICHEEQSVDLKKLRKDLKACRNFNFATAEDMEALLKVEPGGVTPLALMNKEASEVSMVICKSLLKEAVTLMFHPMDSNLAVEITMTDLLRFLKHFNHPVTFVKSN